MAENIFGTKANQAPTNSDLGSMAYQNTDAVSVKKAQIKELTSTPGMSFKRGPTTQPIMMMDFANGGTNPGFIGYTSFGEMGYVDRNGLYRWAPPNDAICDHDPTTLEPIGLPQMNTRVNRLTHYIPGQDTGVNPRFTINQGLTQTLNTTETRAPDGTYTATKIVADTSSTTHRMISHTNPVYNSTHCFSVFVKPVDNGYNAFLHIDCDNTGTNSTWNLSTGKPHSVLRTNGTGTSALIDWGIKEYPNGWYRVHTTINNAAGAGGTTSNDWRIYVTSNTAATTFTATGNESLYVWGCQVEEGPTPSPLIRTSGAALTRSANTATENSFLTTNSRYGAVSQNDWGSIRLPYTDTGFTYFTEGIQLWYEDGGTNYYYWSLDTNNNEYVGLRMGGSSGRMAHQIYTGTTYFTNEIGQEPSNSNLVEYRHFKCAGTVGPTHGLQSSTRFSRADGNIPQASGNYDSLIIYYTQSQETLPKYDGNLGDPDFVEYLQVPISTIESNGGLPFSDGSNEPYKFYLGSSTGSQPSRNGWIKKVAFWAGEADEETLREMVKV